MHPHIKEDAGFTLAELLVSMTLTLVVMAGAFVAFRDASRISETSAFIADTNQNVRVGLNTIASDLIQAGRNIPDPGIPMPSGAGVNAVRRPGPAAGLAFPAGQELMPAVIPGAALGPAVNGQATDLITILYEDPTLAQMPLAAVLADGSSMTVDPATPIDDPVSGVQAGDLILFHNSLGNAIQQVTAVDGQNVSFDSGDEFGLNQRAATQGSIMQLRVDDSSCDPRPRPCFPTATAATRIVMISYFIDATTNPASPRLVRQVNLRTPRVVAMWVENLQISYDLIDGVANPVDQKAPVAPNTPDQIRKVNLFIAARSQARADAAGGFLRSGAATQVTLRNLSFRDRYR